MSASRPQDVKPSVDALGVFGGAPLFPEPLHVGRPNLPAYEALAPRLERIFARGWLTNRGPEVIEFERRVAEIAGARHCVAMCNATTGLSIVMRALGFTGEVIVPSFTFVATVHTLAWQGLVPVFCDVDPRSHTIDPDRVEALVSDRTSAILGVHTWGRTCDVEALADIARRRGLRLVFDAAHAFGCARDGRPVGTFGDAEIFSFHATKFLNTFEGGAVVTNDATLARSIRLMSNFGFADYDHVVSIGLNGKMTEVSAAMGLVSLEIRSRVVEHNRRNHETYRRALRDRPGVRIFDYGPGEQPNYQYVVVEIDAEATGIARDVLLEVLHGENVLARRYFYPGVHRMEPYRSTGGDPGRALPVTRALASRVLVLPTGLGIGEAEIGPICDLIGFCLANAAEISERLPAESLKVARDLT